MNTQTSSFLRLGIGLLAGTAIAAADNLAFGGEVSPIVIVGMILIFASTAGSVWGSRALPPITTAWVFLPAVHLVKHVFAMPDTIHPNTYASIVKLAVFSFAISVVGVAFGLACHRLRRLHPSRRA